MEKSRGKQHIACPGVSGGAEGSRTPVRKHFDRTFSGRSPVSTFPPCADTGQTAQFSRVIVHGRGNSYPPHVRHINDAFPGLWPLRFRRLPLVRQRQQYDCCQLILKLPVLRRSGAAARLSCLHTPVETGAAPYIFRYMARQNDVCIFVSVSHSRTPERPGERCVCYLPKGSASLSGSGYSTPWVSTVTLTMT